MRSFQYTKLTEFRLRAYCKRELALCYFPESDPRVAVNQLTRWINGCPPLQAELEAIGYNPNAKFYNRRQVEAIVGHLGEP